MYIPLSYGSSSRICRFQSGIWGRSIDILVSSIMRLSPIDIRMFFGLIHVICNQRIKRLSLRNNTSLCKLVTILTFKLLKTKLQFFPVKLVSKNFYYSFFWIRISHPPTNKRHWGHIPSRIWGMTLITIWLNRNWEHLYGWKSRYDVSHETINQYRYVALFLS